MERPDILNYSNHILSARNHYYNDLEEYCTQLEIGIKGAIAALSQNHTFPADIRAAKKWLQESIEVRPFDGQRL